MAKVAGLGGYWVVAGTPNVIQHNAEYELDIESINDDVTDSGSTGWVAGLPVIKKFNSGTLSTPEDDASYPEAIGLVEGAILTIWFKRGADAVYDQVVYTIVKSFRYKNNQQKARVYEITLEYGSFTRNVAAPTF